MIAPLRLFVYGSLRSDAQPHVRNAAGPFAALAAAADLEGSASLAGNLYAVSWYPALAPDPSARPVRGEVWRIQDAAILPMLDAFEGDEYVRESHAVRLNLGPDLAGQWVTAFVYRYAAPLQGVPLIPSGDYVDWVRRRNSGSQA